MKKMFFILVMVFRFTTPLCAIPADIEDLSDRKFFPALLMAIESAKQSIYCCMYLISCSSSKNGKVEQILSALSEAQKRGVKVEVVLDRGFETIGKDDLSRKNNKSFSFLKQMGIPVFYDDVKTITHAKYFIVDEALVLSGSFNLSETALSLNRENGMLIRSAEMAKIYLEHYRAVPKLLPERVKDSIPIPEAFMKDKNLGQKMYSKGDRKIMEFFLLCQKVSFEQKTREIRISEALLKEIFFEGKGLVTKKDLISYFVSNLLRRNRNEYGFMTSYRNNKKDKVLEVALDDENRGDETSIRLSELYWKDRWFDRLESESKFFLLYLLWKTESGGIGRSVQITQEEIFREFEMATDSLTVASRQLQRFNLIEKEVLSREKERVPNTYTVNDFYVYADFEKELMSIKENTEPELFEISMKLCDATHEPCDPKCLRAVIEAGRKYGVPVLKKAYEKVDRALANSAYRRFYYMMTVIKNLAGENQKTK